MIRASDIDWCAGVVSGVRPLYSNLGWWWVPRRRRAAPARGRWAVALYHVSLLNRNHFTYQPNRVNPRNQVRRVTACSACADKIGKPGLLLHAMIVEGGFANAVHTRDKYAERRILSVTGIGRAQDWSAQAQILSSTSRQRARARLARPRRRVAKAARSADVPGVGHRSMRKRVDKRQGSVDCSTVPTLVPTSF